MGVNDDKPDQGDNRRETRNSAKRKMADADTGSDSEKAKAKAKTKADDEADARAEAEAEAKRHGTDTGKGNSGPGPAPTGSGPVKGPKNGKATKAGKRSPSGVGKRKARQAKGAKKKPATETRENTLSFILPIMDGIFPPEMMRSRASGQLPAGKGKGKGKGNGNGKRARKSGIDNPAEETYDRSHAHYYVSLTADEQTHIAERERQMHDLDVSSNVPLRFRILNSSMPPKTMGLVLQKAHGLLSGDPFCSEKPKLQKWMDIVLRIPFGVIKPPPVTRESSVHDIQEYIRKTEHNLDTFVYGHSEAKEQIIQTLAKWISNPSSKGNVLGLHGPPGVGKSTLVKHIGDALGTPTVTIPLGGASDGSFLDGHSYVYEGSLPGIVVSAVSKSGCMNPVILLDELDKVSESPKGSEIVNILIHLTDPVQNNGFRDKYLGDVEMDLSQAVFVFTFNDVDAIHPIMKGRMICIETKAYTFPKKYEIAKRHLLPNICKN